MLSYISPTAYGITKICVMRFSTSVNSSSICFFAILFKIYLFENNKFCPFQTKDLKIIHFHLINNKCFSVISLYLSSPWKQILNSRQEVINMKWFFLPCSSQTFSICFLLHNFLKAISLSPNIFMQASPSLIQVA